MKVKCGLHNHTTYVDGKDTPEANVLSAIQKGFTHFGFSEHAHTDFDDECGLSLEATERYFAEIHSLQQKYSDQISLFLGLEIDAHDPQDTSRLDYFIGSVHCVPVENIPLSIDDNPALTRKIVSQYGNMLNVCKEYFSKYRWMVDTLRPDICGHFDLYTKFNASGEFLDESDPVYQKLALDTLDAVIDSGSIIEVNTGAMARGYQTRPYPAGFLLKRLHERNAPIIMSADSHDADKIDFAFSETAEMLRAMGFKTQMALTNNGFIEIKL